MVRLCFISPRGPAWRMNASRSPSQKLEWMTSGLAESSAEVCALYWPGRGLGVVLAGGEAWHLRGLHIEARHQHLHRRLEVAARVLAPGVVLVEPGDRLHARLRVLHVERGANRIHGRRGRGAEHVLVACVLEDARRAAVEEVGELLQLLGHRRDREAVAARDVADDEIDVLPLHQVTELGDLRGRAACLVEQHDLERRAAEALLAVRRRGLAVVQLLDYELGGVLRRYAERRGRRARQEGDDADLHALRVRRRHGGGDGKRDQYFPHATLLCGVFGSSSPEAINAARMRSISAAGSLTSGGRTTARGSLPISPSASFIRLCMSTHGSA